MFRFWQNSSCYLTRAARVLSPCSLNAETEVGLKEDVFWRELDCRNAWPGIEVLHVAEFQSSFFPQLSSPVWFKASFSMAFPTHRSCLSQPVLHIFKLETHQWWSSYDRTWFLGPYKQKILTVTHQCIKMSIFSSRWNNLRSQHFRYRLLRSHA
jgi:hypothetical protein